MRHPVTHKCLKAICFLLLRTSKTIEFYFGGLDLQYRTPGIGFPSCEVGKDNFRDSHGKQIRTKTKNLLNLKVLK